MEELAVSVAPRKGSTSSSNHENSPLETAPSFSIFNAAEIHGFQDSDQQPLGRTVTIGDGIGSGDFSFGKKSMGLIEEEEESLDVIQNLMVGADKDRPVSPRMYLASGPGIGGGGGGDNAWGGDFSVEAFNEDGDEEYYKGKLDEYPNHPLLLRSYANILQSKGDLHEAEEYYFRATLANPEDGEALLQYAQLVWQLHHDQDRALSYFERATQATQDSHVLAAYANFLWEMEDDEEEDETSQHTIQADSKEDIEKVNPSLLIAARNGIDLPDTTNEEDYTTMIEENPNNALLLRKYAQFLCQSKGDPQGGEKYYMLAIRADPGNGETMAQYAKLVWEVHHDREKASSYFERAVQATPEDSYVLAAYAHFLWEAEED